MSAGFLVFSLRLFNLGDDGAKGWQGYLVKIDFGGYIPAACRDNVGFLAHRLQRNLLRLGAEI